MHTEEFSKKNRMGEVQNGNEEKKELKRENNNNK
jgi:hypothetical protein